MIVDLSHWQTVSSWAAMKQAGVQTVILKATQGPDWVDPTFVGRLVTAGQAGLEVWTYHFMDGSDPSLQVLHFLRVAGSLKKFALDIEENTSTGGTVTVAQAAKAVSVFNSLKGFLPAIYMGRYGPDKKDTGLPNSILARCPLWLPEYGSKPIPPPGWKGTALWQYTDGGQLAGVDGPCDLNRGDGW